jgi:hypothetical protein
MAKRFQMAELTIFGTARYDTTNSACTVYADWNDSQPMQKAMPAGLNSRSLEGIVMTIRHGLSPTQASII